MTVRTFFIAALTVALVAAAFIFLAPGSHGPSRAENRISVVATTGMIGDAARAIGGERTDVTALMGPGVDPHLYRQTSSDVAKLARADLVLHNGLYLEAQLEPLLKKLAARQRVVAVAEAIPADRLLGHAQYQAKFDPHVWMDPDLWVHPVRAVRNALIAADPEGRTTYEANATRYLDDLGRISGYVKQALASVPKEKRVLISAHDAFGYFGRAYDFEVLGIQGISTESEAGLRRVEDLVTLIVDRKIASIFVESSVSDRNVRALIEGAAARGHDVKVGGQLFSDAMGVAGTYEGTYAGMIDHNATTIARALGGSAPGRGMAGRLGNGS